MDTIFAELIQPNELERLNFLYAASQSPISVESSRNLQQQAPLGVLKLKSLSRYYNVLEPQLAKWSIYRLLLHSLGWLSLRMNDFVLTESFLVRATLYDSKSEDQRTVTEQAFAVLRLSRFISDFGKSCFNAFHEVDGFELFENYEASANSDKKLSGNRPLAVK